MYHISSGKAIIADAVPIEPPNSTSSVSPSVNTAMSDDVSSFFVVAVRAWLVGDMTNSPKIYNEDNN